MKVLIVKTSSMGDVIHTLPAVCDAVKAIPNITIDWMVEDSFAEIPAWHRSIQQVIPVSLRQWRKNLFKTVRSESWRQFRSTLNEQQYDAIIDAQGLIKSAWVARLAKGPLHGFDWSSAREPLASLWYQHKHTVDTEQHAVERTRQLFAKALGYRLDNNVGDSGLQRTDFLTEAQKKPYVLFLHGTTRDDKHWPDAYWVELAQQITDKGCDIKIPWYNETEKKRAEKIAAVSELATVLPKTNLQGLAEALANSQCFVAVDTGLGHLGAALNVPGISLYGSTSPNKVGAYGEEQKHLSGNNMESISVDAVFKAIF